MTRILVVDDDPTVCMALEAFLQRHNFDVVVTDGGNTVSKYTIDDALEAAHLADAVICSVVVMPITNPVAGISVGLVQESDKFTLLTDIIGEGREDEEET